MSAVSVVRSEAREFLESIADRRGEIAGNPGALVERWNAWRSGQGLPPAADNVKGFRTLITQMERVGLLEQIRSEPERSLPQGREVTGIRLGSERATPLLAERIRRLARERAIARGRVETAASPGIEAPVLGIATPALAAYLRRRRDYGARRYRSIVAGGPPPDPELIEPLGEEALALKERLARLELEFVARGLNPDIPYGAERELALVARSRKGRPGAGRTK